jgi:hypothetical protein
MLPLKGTLLLSTSTNCFSTHLQNNTHETREQTLKMDKQCWGLANFTTSACDIQQETFQGKQLITNAFFKLSIK